MQKTAALNRAAVLLYVSDHVFGNLAAGRCRIHAQRQGELNVLALGEIIQPCQELCDLLLGNLGEHLRKVVDKHMGDVVVAGMQTAEETLEEIVRAIAYA